MAQATWWVEDIERIAQGLLLLNADPQFRAGVMALAHQLGAKKLVLGDGVTWDTLNATPRNDHERQLREGMRWNGR